MELNELEKLWSQLSQTVEKKQLLTDKIIIQMTKQRYKSKFQKLTFYETIGAVVCFIVALLLIANFGKLDTWYLMLCGIFTLAFLIVLPVLVLRSLNRISRLDLAKQSYKDTLVRYAKAKKNLLQVQRFGIFASFGLVLASFPLSAKILDDKDFFQVQHSGWQISFIILLVIFLIFFARWGYRCYKSITRSAEQVLKELDN